MFNLDKPQRVKINTKSLFGEAIKFRKESLPLIVKEVQRGQIQSTIDIYTELDENVNSTMPYAEEVCLVKYNNPNPTLAVSSCSNAPFLGFIISDISDKIENNPIGNIANPGDAYKEQMKDTTKKNRPSIDNQTEIVSKRLNLLKQNGVNTDEILHALNGSNCPNTGYTAKESLINFPVLKTITNTDKVTMRPFIQNNHFNLDYTDKLKGILYINYVICLYNI